MTTISDITSGREQVPTSQSEEDDEILLQGRKKGGKPEEPVQNASMAYADTRDTTLPLEETSIERLNETNQAMAHNLSQSRGKVKLLEKWEGLVLEVYSETFWARLVDLRNPAIEEEAEFPVEEVPLPERDWLLPGNLFYWRIGYRDLGGQRQRESSIHFRRDPSPTQEECERAKEETADIAQLFSHK